MIGYLMKNAFSNTLGPMVSQMIKKGCTVIGSHFYKLLQNLLSLTKPAEKSYQDLIKVLKDHLVPKPVVIAERFKFHKRW